MKEILNNGKNNDKDKYSLSKIQIKVKFEVYIEQYAGNFELIGTNYISNNLK